MAIKMRLRKAKDTDCEACGCKPKEMLDEFDIMIGDTMVTLCDDCVKTLFDKTLKAHCYTNGRVKQQNEIRIINARKIAKRARGH